MTCELRTTGQRSEWWPLGTEAKMMAHAGCCRFPPKPESEMAMAEEGGGGGGGGDSKSDREGERERD